MSGVSKKKFNFEKLNSLCADSIKKINRFVNAQRVLQVILEEQLLVDGFTGKKSKEAAGYQKAIDFLKGCELETALKACACDIAFSVRFKQSRMS